MGVGIEIPWIDAIVSANTVTPLVGVGIEIDRKYRYADDTKSHSPCGSGDWNVQHKQNAKELTVTPLVGVGIEILHLCYREMSCSVTPLVGVGIEISVMSVISCIAIVTPLVGVGIEIVVSLPDASTK